MSFRSVFPFSYSRISPGRRISLLTFVHEILLVAAVSGACSFLSGCASSSASIKTYIDPHFTGAAIHRLAVLPIKNRRLAATEARRLNKDLLQAISAQKPSIVIVSSAEAMRVLSENGLADQGARFHDNYYSNEIPDSSTIRKIGQSLRVDAIIHGEIVNIQQTDGKFGTKEGATCACVRYSIMDVESGRLLWEASSDASVTTATTAELAPPIIYAVLLAQEKILATLPFHPL
jgi:hypothetical protein